MNYNYYQKSGICLVFVTFMSLFVIQNHWVALYRYEKGKPDAALKNPILDKDIKTKWKEKILMAGHGECALISDRAYRLYQHLFSYYKI